MQRGAENHVCKDKVVINMTHYRFNPFVNFELLATVYEKDSLLFVSNSQIDYECFKEKRDSI